MVREGTPFAQAYGTYLASDRHSANVVNIFCQGTNTGCHLLNSDYG